MQMSRGHYLIKDNPFYLKELRGLYPFTLLPFTPIPKFRFSKFEISKNEN
jgi:hypothetical protein